MRKTKDYVLMLILAWVIAGGTAFIPLSTLPFEAILLSTVPIVILFYRYGLLPTVWVSIMYGVGSGALIAIIQNKDMTQTLIYFGAIGIALSINGIFAKNIHRTLNNHRLNSVWLNVITSTIGVSIIIVGSGVIMQNTMAIYNGVYYAIIVVAVTMLMAYSNPKLILTNRSRFLTRKERSKLLND